MGMFDALNGGPEQPSVPEIGPPQTPEELQARKSMWQQVFDKMSSDPNLQRAVMMGGLQMMQNTGGTLGQGIAGGIGTGMQAYSAGQMAQSQQAQQAEDAAMKRENHDMTMRQGESALKTSQENREWNAQVRPKELAKLEAELKSLPLTQETNELKLKIEKLKLEQEPKKFGLELAKLRAQINAQNADAARSLATSSREARKSDTELGIEAYMALPDVQALPLEQRRAAATRAYLQDSRGMGSQYKAAAADEDAISVYRAYQDAVERGDRTALILGFSDADTQAKVQRGKALLKARGVIDPKEDAIDPDTSKPVPPKPVVSVYRDEKTGELIVNHQMSSGKIGE